MKRAVACVLAGFLLMMSVLTGGCAKEGSKPAGTETSATGPSEWRIPYLIFLSGPLAGHAQQHKWVTEEIVARINAAGGIAGKPLAIEYIDTSLDATKAVAAMSKAIDMGALCVLGPMNDMECKAAMPVAIREGVFCLSGTGTEDVWKEFKPWLLNVTAPREETAAFAPYQWLSRNPGVNSVVAVIQPLYPEIERSYETQSAQMEAMGVKALPAIKVPEGMMDYSSIAVRAVDSGAQGFWVGCTEEVAAKIVRELIDRGVKPEHIWLHAECMGPTFLKQTAGVGDGCYSNAGVDFQATELQAELNQKYKQISGGTSLAPLAHIQAELLFLLKEAIEKQGITGDPAKLKEERIKIRDYCLNRKGFQGIVDKYDIVDGQARSTPQRLFQIRNGKTELIEELTPRYENGRLVPPWEGGGSSGS